MLASGVWLLLAGPRVRDTVLPIHKVSFIVWLCLTGVHVLGHVLELPSRCAPTTAPARRAPRPRTDAWAASSPWSLSLAAGVALALLLRSHFGAWQHAEELAARLQS